MSEKIKDFVRNVVTKNYDDARVSLQNEITNKLADRFDTEKMNIASSMFKKED